MSRKCIRLSQVRRVSLFFSTYDTLSVHKVSYFGPTLSVFPGVTVSFFSTSCRNLTDLQSSLTGKRVVQINDVPFWSTDFNQPAKPPKISQFPLVESSTAQLQPSPSPPGTNKRQPKDELKKPSLLQRIKKEVIHYYHGFRLLGLEVKIASGMCFRVLAGHTLTRRERKQLIRTLADIIRLVPFAVFIIVPFMEFLLPFYLKFFPFMLPSTFKDKSAESDRIQQRLKAKLELTRFLQETLVQTSGASKGDQNTPKVAEFQDFIKRVQESGQPAEAEEITKFSKLFEDQVTLESLDNKQLRMLCQILSLPTVGPNHLLRFQIWMRVRQLKAEDHLLIKEGVDQIPPWELQSLCQERGMRSVGLSQDRLRSQLSQWLALHLEKNVPITLLLFSRALHVTQASLDDLPLQQAIAQLPASASAEAAARVLEATPELDPFTKMEVLRKEQDNIKAARAQRKQELAEQEAAIKPAKPTSETLTDQAPVVKGFPNEELAEAAYAPSATETSSKPKLDEKELIPATKLKKTSKEQLLDDLTLSNSKNDIAAGETEISVEDLAEIETAIAKSSSALQDEAFHDLQERVAETAKLQQQHQASLVASEKVVDKRTTRAAARLEARVQRMIDEMDGMIDKLAQKRAQLLKDIELREVHVKHSSEPSEKTEILDAIKADHDQVVDINDLLLSLRRIQKVPDDARWEKILKVLDEDRDGKIELKHVISVIELLGSENVKLSSKEVGRVLEMIDNEELANVIQQAREDEELKETEAKFDKVSSTSEHLMDKQSAKMSFSLPKSTDLKANGTDCSKPIDKTI